MKKLLPLLGLFTLLISTTTLDAQRLRRAKQRVEAAAKAKAEMAQDTVPATPAKEKDKKKPKFKKYAEVITDEAVSNEGLFYTHIVGDKYYFEIPFNRLDADLLWVSRIAKIPSGLGGGYFNAGTKTNEQVVHWERVRDQINLRSVSFNSVADESLPINISVQNNNFAPLIMSFPIATFNADSTAAVVDVTDLFSKDIPAISGLSTGIRQRYKVRSLDGKRSFINRLAAYPENVEVRHEMTYTAGAPPSNARTGTISLEMAQSIYLLPEEPMMPRLHDPRVGWFTVSQIDYGSPALKADEKTYIRRWRMEPKDPDAYARGELVEPIKPIVYYIDPATPAQFVPYFKQGIEDWQRAFEVAGFKNAIIAKEAPTPEEDPDWSPEDARYSVVRYVASETRNAMGPSVSDPRSGEIIESDIIWYHNHLRSYRNRYLLETGAANPGARTLNTRPEEIGEMMRMVIAHEVGHALGLPHNMKASYAYPVDSLRSATFTNEWGLATTIMDYTRYNYVAQPEDKGVRWVRMLGPYDLYAINWGYRDIPGVVTPAAELPTLRSWINAKQNDPKYLFGGSSRTDPSSQTEAVGDDPVLASTYALKNLKRVAPKLAEWTATPGEGYADLAELYGELLGVWSRFSGHVVANVGGVYELPLTTDQPGYVYNPLSRTEQEKSVDWLLKYFFTTPDWLMPENITRNIGPSGTVERISGLHSRQLRNLLSESRLSRLVDQTLLNPDAYSVNELFTALNTGVFSEINSKTPIDAVRRNLQRAYVAQLGKLMQSEENMARNDVNAAARGALAQVRGKLEKDLLRYRNTTLRDQHLRDLSAQIEGLLTVE